ncbi:unnamed protein product [Didymodactylos carnosus]|uniref:Sorting nexin n=1 Tax=Didymodactylos carnosus TaxID=1234261 RepID=A0A8S2CQE0_9BILA|nr:unnamed protein product [Didymodactylos carnosus]CAF3513290.1 unnamed protein product [Didymodactylos carnosus]
MFKAETTDTNKQRGESVDLNENDSLLIDISDALSEKDKVKFTVHTKTKLAVFSEREFTVSRQHEEFIWLHDRYVENEDYAGLIIPPPPPRPDFDSSRGKLQKLSDSEGSITAEEYEKMKQELEAEYLAMFKKTVSVHEVFLQRLAAHHVLRSDNHFRVFLEYKEDLSVRGKNAKEQLSGFFKTLTKTADEVFLVNQKDQDEFFERQKQFLINYNAKIKDATNQADRYTRCHKTGWNALATTDKGDLSKYLLILADLFEKARKLESRVQSDTDLKLSDTLRYYLRDSKAALDLMYRRSRCLANFDTANKNLDKARQKNKDVQQAETTQQTIKTKFENLSEKAKDELNDFKTRRVQMFRKNLIELSDLQIKHAKAQIQMIRSIIQQTETAGSSS